jgi:hypothetical protein
MPDSACLNCGEETRHTEEDTQPLCEECTERLAWAKILIDIVDGRLDIQEDDQGRPIIPGVQYPAE